MDKRGHSNQPHFLLTRGHLRLEEQKRCYDFMFYSREGSTARHLANSGNLTSPAGGDTKHLMLGSAAGTTNIATCPLGKVLTYKNLIYLLNLQVCVF